MEKLRARQDNPPQEHCKGYCNSEPEKNDGMQHGQHVPWGKCVILTAWYPDLHKEAQPLQVAFVTTSCKYRATLGEAISNHGFMMGTLPCLGVVAFKPKSTSINANGDKSTLGEPTSDVRITPICTVSWPFVHHRHASSKISASNNFPLSPHC